MRSHASVPLVSTLRQGAAEGAVNDVQAVTVAPGSSGTFALSQAINEVQRLEIDATQQYVDVFDDFRFGITSDSVLGADK